MQKTYILQSLNILGRFHSINSPMKAIEQFLVSDNVLIPSIRACLHQFLQFTICLYLHMPRLFTKI